MSTLPIELWRLIASTDIETYYALAQVVRDLYKICPVGATSWEDHFTVAGVHVTGCRYWKLRDKLHRGGDQPAHIWPDGQQEWWQHGELHRDGDQPAIIYPNGRREWWQNDVLHRDGDKPAVIRADGGLLWYQRGVHHRDSNQPAVIRADGWCVWWQHGELLSTQMAARWANKSRHLHIIFFCEPTCAKMNRMFA